MSFPLPLVSSSTSIFEDGLTPEQRLAASKQRMAANQFLASLKAKGAGSFIHPGAMGDAAAAASEKIEQSNAKSLIAQTAYREAQKTSHEKQKLLAEKLSSSHAHRGKALFDKDNVQNTDVFVSDSFPAIQIRVSNNPIPQSQPGMPKSVYGMHIHDREKIIYTEDPLHYFTTHIDTIRDFNFCIQKPKEQTCKSIPLPPEIKENLLHFFKLHKDTSTWNCANFAAAAHGEYPNAPCTLERCEPADFVSGKWDLKFQGRTEPTNLKSGDLIFMEGGGWNGHAALYLGDGFYLSKLGYKHGLSICKLEDMKTSFQTLTLALPKK